MFILKHWIDVVVCVKKMVITLEYFETGETKYVFH